MSLLIPSIDKHPVYIDSNGNPLSFGKLYYYNIGTNDLKTVYQDGDKNIAADNPQILNASGRTDTEIYLGDGQYTVVAYKFNGTDPNTAPPEDWSIDNQWDDQGSVEAVRTNDITTVDTIAELRDYTATDFNFVEVLGYYSAGDMFTRTYHWDANNTEYDNGGTIIKNPLYSTGAWVLDIDGDTLDVRIFGMLPGRSDTYNSQFAAISSAAIAPNTNNPRSIYFPSGIYKFVAGTQTVQTKVIIDKGVYFSNVSSGSIFYMDLASDYEIQKTDTFKAASSTGDVYLKFTGTNIFNEINIRWFGAKMDGTTNDSIPFGYAIVYTTSNSYTFLIDGPMLHASSINRSIYNNIRFIKSGKLINNSSHSITFRPSCDIINETNYGSAGGYTKRYGVLSATYYSTLIFDTHHVRASWFFDDTTSDTTIALNSVIGGIGVEGKPTFIFDAKNNFFNGELTLANSSKFNFQYEQGRFNNSSSSYVYLPNLDGADGCTNIITSGGFAIGGVTTKYNWFIPNSPSDSDYSTGFARALNCAIGGNGELDLCNKQCRMNVSSYTINAIVNSPMLKIYNGRIYCTTSGATAIYLNNAGTLYSLTLENLLVIGGTCSLLKIMGSTVITDIFINNVRFDTTSNSNYAIVINEATSITGFMKITHSFIQARNLMQNACEFRLNIDNCDLKCDADLGNARPVISNNYIQGGSTGLWRVKAMWSALITGNWFYKCDLYARDNGGGIDHVITGNQFSSDDTKWSRIMFEASTVNTKFQGAVVTGNSWMGNVTAASFKCIECITYGSGTYDSGTTYLQNSTVRSTYHSNHMVRIADNQSMNYLMILPRTEGILYINSPYDGGMGMTSSIVDVDGYKRTIFKQNLLPEMFYIPGSTYAITGSVTIATDTFSNDTQDVSNQYWSDPLGICAEYRNDGKFAYSIHWTKNQNPYPSFLSFSFKIYDKVTRNTSL